MNNWFKRTIFTIMLGGIFGTCVLTAAAMEEDEDDTIRAVVGETELEQVASLRVVNQQTNHNWALRNIKRAATRYVQACEANDKEGANTQLFFQQSSIRGNLLPYLFPALGVTVEQTDSDEMKRFLVYTAAILKDPLDRRDPLLLLTHNPLRLSSYQVHGSESIPGFSRYPAEILYKIFSIRDEIEVKLPRQESWIVYEYLAPLSPEDW